MRKDFNKVNFSLGKDLIIPEHRQQVAGTSEQDNATCEELITLCGYVVNEFKLPLQFTWTIDDVLVWIKNLGFSEYQNTFKVNFINGRKLLLVDASALVKMNIKNFDHIKIITNDIRRMYKIQLEKFNRSISLPPEQPETLYKFYKIPTGSVHDLCLRTEFFKKMKFMPEVKVQLNHFERLHQWLQHIPDFQSVRIGDVKKINLYFVKPSLHQETEIFEEESKCKCTMPPCECNWSEMEKLPPWRLTFLVKVDDGTIYNSFCAKTLNEVDLITLQEKD